MELAIKDPIMRANAGGKIALQNLRDPIMRANPGGRIALQNLRFEGRPVGL